MLSEDHWHVLLAPLPSNAVVRRRPVSSPGLIGSPEASAIAGWESITVELSAGEAGLRHVMVTVDAGGTPLSAGDTVLYNVAPRKPGNVRYVTESIGGRLESDGRFRGTRWHTDSESRPDDDSPPLELVPSTPTADEVAALLALVEDILRRGQQHKE